MFLFKNFKCRAETAYIFFTLTLKVIKIEPYRFCLGLVFEYWFTMRVMLSFFNKKFLYL